MSKPIILVHGSWMDGTAWNDVAAELRRLGETVLAPTLAGHGPDARRDVTHGEVVASLTDLIEQQDLRDVILVGHSFGGTVIQKAADLMPERIERVVFVNAFVLLDGECLSDHVSEQASAMFAQLAAGDGCIRLPFPFFREAFANDADTELAKRMHEALHPEFANLFDERIALPNFASGQFARSYLYCWDDHGLPHGEQTGWYPKFGNRLGLFRYVSMPGSHMALRTRPVELAHKIIEASRD